MEDLEEIVVFNYIEGDPGVAGSNSETSGSFDENQNPKSTQQKAAGTKRKTGRKPQNGRKRKQSGSSINSKRSSKSPKIEKIKPVTNGAAKTKPNGGISLRSSRIKTQDSTNVVFKVETLENYAANKSDSAVKSERVKSEQEDTVQKNITITSANGNKPRILDVVDLEPNNKLTNKMFKCEQCLYVGNSKANLERHSLIHKDPKDILWYKCTECEYKSKYESQLKSHTLIHKKPDEIVYFQCPHCEMKCSRKHNLTHHIRSIHSNRVNDFKCAECSYSTFSKDRLAAHLKMHSKYVFMCHLCKFVTKRKEYLESHVKVKHTKSERPFLCDTCAYRGKTKRELDKHYSRMHNKEQLKIFKCNQCEFNSIYKKNLEFHLLHMHQNSEGFQKFICGHCDKEFAYKNGLKTHIIRIHLKLSDADWHKCQECRYKSKDVNTLKRHIKRNHGSPRLHCKQCVFGTNRQKSMIAHMKTHEVTDGRILKCTKCPYRIIQAVSFLYHMRVIHNQIIHSKDIADYYLDDVDEDEEV